MIHFFYDVEYAYTTQVKAVGKCYFVGNPYNLKGKGVYKGEKKTPLPGLF